MKIDIIPFTMDLYDDVFALWKQCDGVGLSDADSRENIQAYLDRNPAMSFVVIDKNIIVASILAGHDGRRGFIHHLAVQPSYRRLGMGTALVKRSFKVLHAAGIQKVHLLVFKNNANAIAFWKSIGWSKRTDIDIMSKTIDLP